MVIIWVLMGHNVFAVVGMHVCGELAAQARARRLWGTLRRDR